MKQCVLLAFLIRLNNGFTITKHEDHHSQIHHTSTSSTRLNNGITLTKQKDHHSQTHHTSISSTQLKYQYVLKKSNAIPYIKKKTQSLFYYQLLKMTYLICFILLSRNQQFLLHTPLYIVTAYYCHLGTSELFFIFLKTSKTINLGELLVDEYD